MTPLYELLTDYSSYPDGALNMECLAHRPTLSAVFHSTDKIICPGKISLHN